MNVWDYLFSFRGRINRAKFWAFYLVQTAFVFVFAAVFATLDAVTGVGANLGETRTPLDLGFLIAVLVLAVVWIPMIYAQVAIFVKRLHDRNKSAWWLAVFYGPTLALFAILPFTFPDAGGRTGISPLLPVLFVPAWVCQMWGAIEFHFLRGTVGDNRYGPDPLAGKA